MPLPADQAAADIFGGQYALGARASVAQVADRNPDKEALVQQQARALGAPYESARNNPDLIDRRSAANAVDYQNLARTAPRTARFMSSTSNAAIAHDDIGVLGQIEQFLKGNAITAPVVYGAQVGIKAMGRVANDISTDIKQQGGAMPYLRKVLKTDLSAPLEKGVAQVVSGPLGALESSQELAEKVDPTAGLQRRLFGGTMESGLAALSRRARHAIDQSVDYAGADTQLGRDIQMGVESVPLSLAALAATLGTGGTATGLGLIGATTYGQSYGQARDQGVGVGRASLKSAIDAAVEVGTEYLPEKWFLHDATAHVGFGRMLADQLKAEVPGEQVATLLQDFNQWAMIDGNQGKSFDQYVSEIVPHAYSTLIATGVGLTAVGGLGAVHGAVVRGINKAVGTEAKAAQAEAVAQHVEDITKLAKASALRTRDPQTFQALVDDMAEGSPVEDVYVPPDKLADALFQGGFDEEQGKAVDNALGPRIKEALEQGTDVRVPMSEFATLLAGTPAEKALIDHIKTDPNGMSRAEAEQFMADKGEALKAEIEKELTRATEDEVHKADLEQVRTQILDQLSKANRFTAKVNERYADLHAAFYSTLAKRMNVSPNTLYERFPIRILNRAMPDSHLSQPPHSTISGEEIAPLNSDVKALRSAARSWYDANLRDKTVASDALGGREVRFGGSRKAFSASADPLKIRAFAALPEIIAHGRLVNSAADTRPNSTTKAWHFIEGVADIGGKRVAVRASVREDANGNLYYNHVLQEGEAPGNQDTASKAGPDTEGYAQNVGEKVDEINLAVREIGGELHQSENPIFYSELERAVENSSQAKASPQQWLATLSKTPGVKKEEIEWTELPEWLETQDGPVTREELLAFVREGGVQVEEVDHHSANDVYEIVEYEGHESDTGEPHYEVRDRGTGALFYDTNDLGDAKQWIEAENGDQQTFEDYTEPGGEDYHELLLTLPPGAGGNPERSPSTHFDEPGVVAHLRFKTRQTTDGKKLLFIEEVQSDWHQKGRDQGYEESVSDAELKQRQDAYAEASAALQKSVSDFEEVSQSILAQAAVVGYEETTTASALGNARMALDHLEAQGRDVEVERHTLERLVKANNDARLRVNETHQALEHALQPRGIPDAPFKSTWPALVMKRAIRWAADNGFEAVAWTTGEQQRNRYDLGRTVGEIRVQSAGDGRYTVNAGYGISQDLIARNLASENEMSVPVMTPEQIGEVFGKDLGSRMMALADQANGEEVRVQGDDLKIGGEGMLAFYDRNLVNITNNILKKLGGAKVEPIGVDDFAGSAPVIAYDAEHDDAPLTNPGFVITPEIAAHAREGFALFQKNRGAYSPATNTISLLEHADLSTFLHESGHFFLDVYEHIASQPGAPQQITDDFNALLKWFGVKDIASWNALTLDQKRDGHEKFARGFEAYLFTGKAPASRLRELFRTFRSWLVAVYKHATALGVRPTAQIRDVMDRMLATDDEIAEAQAARSMEPLFTDQAQSGMTEDQWRDYQRTNQTATQEAEAQLGQRSLRDLKWFDNARSREVNRLKRQAAQIRKAMRARVAAEVANEPVYRAQQYLKRGVLDGETTEGPHKLSIASVDKVYSDQPDRLAEIKRALGYGKYGILAEQGLDAEATSQVFGFSSADHLIGALAAAEPMNEKIAGLTEQRLLEEHGDLTDPQSIEEAASEAVHNEFRARAVAAELSALAKAAGKPRLLAQAARQFAEDTVARTRVRDLRPAKYEAAASRAAKAAMKALGEGNLPQAALEKRNQLFNLYAAKGAMKARDEVGKALALFDRLTRPATGKSIDPSYRDQIVQLLDRYDLNRGTTLKDIDKRTSLAEWVEKQKEMGLTPVVPDDLLNDAQKRSYKLLTVEELRGLVDTVRNIEHLGRLKSKLLTAKKDRDFAEAVERAASTIIGNAVSFKRPKVERNALADKAKAGVFDFLALHRKFASLIRQMDGFRDGGPLWELFVRPMNAAGDREVTMRREATERLIETMKPLKDARLTQKLYIPEIDDSLSLEGRLAVALNMGNEINRSRLRDGDNWTDEQIDAIGRTLTAGQWGVVQGVWDFINSYWPEVAAKERRVTGVEPEKVEGDPFQIETADGQTLQLPGGYYPIKYDADRSSRSEADEASEIAKAMMQGAYTRATTRRGHTKARVDTVKRPVRKDIGVIGQHLTEVIHDLSWHEYLIDANRLLGNAQIDGAVRDHYGPEVVRAMKRTIEDVAAGDVPARNTFERAVNWLRTGATIAGMAWSMTTALLQPLGLAQSIKRVGAKHVAKGMGQWLGDAARLQSTVKWITEQSPMMAQRAGTLNREIGEIRNHVVRSKAGEVNEAIKGSFFYLIAKLQLMADVPTWIGQYNKSIDAGEEHERAVALADQAVLDSQGGGQIKDLAGIQRGGPMLKVWTNFYSYFSVTYNLAAESVGETRLVGASRLPILAADMLLLFAVPAAIQALMLDLMRGDDKDWEQIGKDIGVNVLMAPFQSMVGVRDIAAALSGDERSQAPAGIVGRQFYKLGTQAQQGKADEAFWKSLNQVGGILFHYPAAQVQRTALGVAALANGDTKNPAAVLLGPPQQARKAKRF
jgi:hypothetical protein